MKRHTFWGLVVVLVPAVAAGAGKPEEKAKSDPPGAPVTAKLVAKTDRYPLDLGGKSAAEFRKQLQDAEATGAYPMPPKVDLVLELTNTSDKEVQIRFGGTQNVITLDLKGPGAETVAKKRIVTPKFLIAPKTESLAPGKSVSVPIASLGFGLRNMTHAAYWTAPGEYTLRASYQIATTPAPKGARESGNGFGGVTLTSAPITIKVEAK